MTALTIELLGGLTVKLHGRPLTTFKSRKAEALLVYLACGARPYPREELAAFFWDSSDPAQAQANLRKTLSDLRQHLDEFFFIDRHAIGLNLTGDVWRQWPAGTANCPPPSATLNQSWSTWPTNHWATPKTRPSST